MAFMTGLVVVSTPLSVSAACTGAATTCNNGCPVDTAIVSCKSVTVAGKTDNGIWSLLLTAINILSAGVGVAAIGGIVYGSILYTSAGGSADQTKKAIEVIRNVIIGLIAYALMFAVLNFIIPGGLFG